MQACDNADQVQAAFFATPTGRIEFGQAKRRTGTKNRLQFSLARSMDRIFRHVDGKNKNCQKRARWEQKLKSARKCQNGHS